MLTTETMSRAQRRAAKKSARRKPHRDSISRHAAWTAIETMLVKGSVADNDDVARMELITPAYAALDALTGTATCAPWLDEQGFVKLNEMNVFAFCLAARLHKDGTASTKAILEPTEQSFMAAANALVAIGERMRKTGKYRANGDELSAIRESFALLDQLVKVAPQGHTLSALIEAAHMIDAQMRKQA